jgi:hypothetical protein
MIVTLALRGLQVKLHSDLPFALFITNLPVQVIFAGVVLALSIILIKDFGPGRSWSLTSYGAFCGGASLLFALLGVAACFVDALQGIVMFALDGIASFFLLAGGIVCYPSFLSSSTPNNFQPRLTPNLQAYAATIKVGNCADIYYLADHDNPFAPSANKIYPGVGGDEKKYARAVLDDATTRCRETQASTAFIWFLAACFVGTLAVSFMGRKKGSNSIA